jgi:hypothetical protein
MRRADHLLKTMTALRLCLEQCRRAPSPYEALEERLKDLRQNPDFSPDDLAEIEAAARRALANCSGNATASGGTGLPSPSTNGLESRPTACETVS